MIPGDVRTALKTRLETISGLRVYDILPEIPVAPCAIVGFLDMTFDTAMGRGLDAANVDLDVIVQRMSSRAGQSKLDNFLAGTGAGSVKTAIEGDKTLGGKVDTCRVISATSGNYDIGGTLYLTYRYRLDIWG